MNFFVFIKERISYNSVYLITARVENFAATVTLNIYVYQSSNEIDVFTLSISLLRKILNGGQN